MKLSLSENIAKHRKARSMTQEQLAEALGVTFAAVSKWERGVATPELRFIAEMAELFGVSMDALVGFEVMNNGVTDQVDRIRTLQRRKQYGEAIAEAERALLRYPNDFRVVLESGNLYVAAGIESKTDKYLLRGIDLLDRSILLISQNSDPSISEISIRQSIAQCYIALGKTNLGIDILKKYNVSGVHNSLIAIALTGNDITYTDTPEYSLGDAVPYMTESLGDILTNILHTMMAYSNYYYKSGNYSAGREALLWMIDFMENMKLDKEKVAYVDKVIAPAYSECADFSFRLGEIEKVEPYLRLAHKYAIRYDADPVCSLVNLKFFNIGDISNATTYDDLGETAMSAIDAQLAKPNRSETLRELWKKIKEDN